MITFAINQNLCLNEENSGVTWVTKRQVKTVNSGKFIGLEFHKITPRIKNTILKNNSKDDINY